MASFIYRNHIKFNRCVNNTFLTISEQIFVSRHRYQRSLGRFTSSQVLQRGFSYSNAPFVMQWNLRPPAGRDRDGWVSLWPTTVLCKGSRVSPLSGSIEYFISVFIEVSSWCIVPLILVNTDDERVCPPIARTISSDNDQFSWIWSSRERLQAITSVNDDLSLLMSSQNRN